MRGYPKQMGMRIGETRKAWFASRLDMIVDTGHEIIIERKGPRDLIFHFLAVGRTWGVYGTWYRYTGYTMREAKRKFREEYGLIGAHLRFRIAD